MPYRPVPQAETIVRLRWCRQVDPAADGPLKLCLGLTDCSRCGFAQWLERMDADRPTPQAGSAIPSRLEPALAA